MELTELPNLSVSQEEMDAWAHTCGRANYALLQTLQALARADQDTGGQDTGGQDTQAGDNTQIVNRQVVVEHVHSAAVAIDTLLQFLVRAGAARPAHAPAQAFRLPQPTSSVPTAADTGAGLEPAPPAVLPRLDTPAARRLLALLREAQEVAGDVDDERYGQAGNAGWAEAIEKLAFPLSVEIHGPPKALEPHP